MFSIEILQWANQHIVPVLRPHRLLIQRLLRVKTLDQAVFDHVIAEAVRGLRVLP
jgi:hypothetical protein